MDNRICLAEACDGIRTGELSAVELLDWCLARIHAHDRDVRAWVLVDETTARREAEKLTAEAKAGRFRGPLHGIPIGIKDIIDVAGLPTEAGSPLRKGWIAATDAPVVASLRQAGAIIVGKTVTVEFACFDPSPTRNPWNLERSPGGSSSGSAAALAMGMCLGALGTQTGGSLVRPSSYCGVATSKPTFGRVGRTGVVPVSYHFDHVGPMARRVRDLAILLECLPPSNDFGPPNPATGRDTRSRRPRLGLVEAFFMQEAAPNVRQAVENAIKVLSSDADIDVVEPSVDFTAIQEVHTSIMATEVAAYHRKDFTAHRESYGPKISGLLDQGLATSGVALAEALDYLHDYRRRVPAMLDGFDALIMPATDTTAPGLETTGPKSFQCPWSCAGLPVVSLPCGLADNGMPVAVQLVGQYYVEKELLRIAEWCEECFGFGASPALLGASP